MLLPTHALAGAVIGKNIDNISAIIIISLILHFVMDSFRHGEYIPKHPRFKKLASKVALDAGTATALVLAFLYFSHPNAAQTRNILVGMLCSMLPDLLTFFHWKFGGTFLGKIKKLHNFSHRYKKYPKYSPEREWTLRNAANDIIFSAISIILLFVK